MPRRKTKHKTGIARLEKVHFHDAWVAFICLKCKRLNTIRIGTKLLSPEEAHKDAKWKCEHCKYIHGGKSALPFKKWPKPFTRPNSIYTKRFWEAFFRISTEHPESYWKQCNVCGRILPFFAFSKHSKWGPLERQMECRGCKGVINAKLNPLRTKEQLYESSIKRRIADLLLEGENEKISSNFFKKLFKRFNDQCFKTKKSLNIKDRKSWAIDHILPSKYLYPLTVQNAALLSKEANNAKGDRWPSEFYTNSELIKLAKITGADLNLLSNKKPLINPHIDVNACVTRFLKVRERSNLSKRLQELRGLLMAHDLTDKLSKKNKQMLGL